MNHESAPDAVKGHWKSDVPGVQNIPKFTGIETGRWPADSPNLVNISAQQEEDYNRLLGYPIAELDFTSLERTLMAATRKTITLPCFGIVIEVVGEGGRVTSTLHHTCSPNDDAEQARIDTVHTFLLAMAVAGIDLETPAMLAAIETTVGNLA